MLGTVIKGWRRYLSLFSHQEKSIPGGYDSKILSICVPHFTTNLLGLMHLKPIKCFTSRKYIIHAEPMRQLRPFAVPLSKMGSLILPQCLHWVCFSGLATFHPDFHPDAVPSLGPGEPRKLPSRLSTLVISKPLAIPASAEITELTASLWSGGSKFQGKEEEEEESHPRAPVTCQTMGQAYPHIFP